MDISDKDLLNEDSLLVPATQTQSPIWNTFTSELIRCFSLKSSQQKPVLVETIINNTKKDSSGDIWAWNELS